MSVLKSLDWSAVRDHYDVREEFHHELLSLYRKRKVVLFAELILGIKAPAGNYSAAEHRLGPRVLAENVNAPDRVFRLAEQFMSVKNGHQVPELVRQAALRYFRVGVGSEASCMVNPSQCWVTNTRTLWTHLVIKHADNFRKASEELRLYRDDDTSSEMAYTIWSTLHGELAASMTRIAEEGALLARKQGVEPGSVTYLWADAIANELYASRPDLR